MAHRGFPVARLVKAATGLLVAILFCANFQTVQANENATLILHQNARNWPITAIRINGQDSRALLDTGATIAMIDDEYLEFDLPDPEASSATRVLGIGGHRIVPVAKMSSLSVGAQSWQNLRVAVNTENRFPVQQNILPVSLFETAIVDFDFPNGRVQFYNGRPRHVRDTIKSTVRYRDVQGLIFIPVKVNGVRGKALIDTGADASFLNTTYSDLAGGKVRPVDEKSVQGSDLERNLAPVYSFRKLLFAENQLTNFSIPVVETDLFLDLGFDEEPMMVIGMDLLRHFRLQIDLKRKRLTFLN